MNKQEKRKLRKKTKVSLSQRSVFALQTPLSAGADKQAGYPKWKLYITVLFYLEKKFFHVLI